MRFQKHLVMLMCLSLLVGVVWKLSQESPPPVQEPGFLKTDQDALERDIGEVLGSMRTGCTISYRVHMCVDGSLDVSFPGNQQAEQNVRRINKHLNEYLPVVEKMLGKFLENRDLNNLRRLVYLISELGDSSESHVSLSRFFLDYHESIPIIAEEIVRSGSREDWVRRCSSFYLPGPSAWSWQTRVWRSFSEFEVGGLRALAEWRCRSISVRNTALEILEDAPFDEARALGERWSTAEEFRKTAVGTIHRGRMEAALDYLEAAFPGDREARDEVVRICRNPESAIRQLGMCDERIAHTVRVLSR